MEKNERLDENEETEYSFSADIRITLKDNTKVFIVRGNDVEVFIYANTDSYVAADFNSEYIDSHKIFSYRYIINDLENDRIMSFVNAI